MRFGPWLRRYWPETLLFMAVVLPWLSLFALGLVWLWQGGHVWIWALAAAALGVVAWPLSTLVSRRANEEARLALGDLAAPSRSWNSVERRHPAEQCDRCFLEVPGLSAIDRVRAANREPHVTVATPPM